MNAQETVKYICEALLERKGKEIDVLHVEHLTSLTEYFVICSGDLDHAGQGAGGQRGVPSEVRP